VASLNFKAAINHCSKNNLWPKLGLVKNGLDLNKNIRLYSFIVILLLYEISLKTPKYFQKLLS